MMRSDGLQFAASIETSIESSVVEAGGIDSESSVSDDSEAIFTYIACSTCNSPLTISVCLSNRFTSLGFLGHRYRGPPVLAV